MVFVSGATIAPLTNKSSDAAARVVGMVDVQRITTYDAAAAARLAAVVDACVAAGEQAPLDEAARLHLGHHGLEGAAIWLHDDGFALLRSHGVEHGLRQELDLAVAPAARRHGTGRALLDAATASAGSPTGERTLCPAPLTAWSHGDHPGAAALAEATGFRRTRELLVLARTATPSDFPSQPDPRIRTWRTSDGPELLRVNAAAFAHHPEQGAMDAVNLAERMAEPWFDPAGLLLAVDGDRVLGFHWTKVHPGGHGEVYVLAVDPAAHGQGLGRALTEAGLRHLAEVGCTRIHLYVEADNAPALALYRGRGFTTDHTHVQYTRP